MIMDKRSSRDLLSDLPLGIIHSILELVPIRDAVRTSILSMNWRYKWASLPRLVFDDQCANDETRLKYLITRALFLHKGPILEFKLNVSSMRSCPDTDHWLLCLSKNHIRELSVATFDSDSNSDFRVHSSVYDCQKLTRLDLIQCELLPPPPTFKGFSCLRSLSLLGRCIPSNAIESILANSPILENFILVQSGISELRIRAPNLKSLRLGCGSDTKICLHAPLLTMMIIVGLGDDCFTIDHLHEESRLCNFTEFLDGFRDLQKLGVTSFLIKFLSIGIVSCRQHSSVFHHLRIIGIDGVSFEGTKERWVVYRLIMSAPNLSGITIHIIPYITKDDVTEAPRVWDHGCITSNFRSEKLKCIEMEGVCGLPCEMEFLKFLLVSSPLLEIMGVGYSSNVVDEEMQRLSLDLLMHHKASPNAKIECFK